MKQAVTEVIDGDGHIIIEHDDEIYPYLADKYPIDTLRTITFSPDLDGRRRANPKQLGHDAAGWEIFLDQARISTAVLYPTVKAFNGLS